MNVWLWCFFLAAQGRHPGLEVQVDGDEELIKQYKFDCPCAYIYCLRDPVLCFELLT
jgi:hypothetical protein